MYDYDFFLTDTLEKVYPNKRPRTLNNGQTIWVFKGEIPAIQLIYTRRKEKEARLFENPVTISITGTPVTAVLRSVELVPADFPAYEEADEHYTTTEPGLFPDLLRPLPDNKIYPVPGQYRSIWIDFPGISSAEDGIYQVIIQLTGDRGVTKSNVHTESDPKSAGYYRELIFFLNLLPQSLPPQKLIHTEWFHTDCLAEYYRVNPLSEEHWKIIEEFMRPMSSVYGINMLLTPVFTPPLDTSFGSERLTVQLVDIEITRGKYKFGFKNLERWCGLCKKYDILYLEIAHFFTQWGGKATPKIMACENGVEKRIFGWDVTADNPEYRNFLHQFIPALRNALNEFGYDNNHVVFHVSDEPPVDCIENYKTAKMQIADLVSGSIIVDAFSNIRFYQEGIVENPIVANNHIMPFIEANVSGLWVYHCCAQYRFVPNRFFAMPSERNRILGILMYLYNIKGFLHWGYNYYYSRYSKTLIDPYFDTSASRSFPAGDPYLVYPGTDGKPVSSIRGEVLRQAIEDVRLLNLVEEKQGRQWTIDLIHEDFPEKITFERYPCYPEYFLNLREKAVRILTLTAVK
jgi:hypothetical protein